MCHRHPATDHVTGRTHFSLYATPHATAGTPRELTGRTQIPPFHLPPFFFLYSSFSCSFFVSSWSVTTYFRSQQWRSVFPHVLFTYLLLCRNSLPLFPFSSFYFFLFFFIVGSGIAFLAVRHADPFLHVFITYLLTSGIL